jgi:type III restriction enzyme
MSSTTLAQKYDVRVEDGTIDIASIPSFISDNLHPRIILRPYQEEALSRFIYYIEKDKTKLIPVHLLFNMATGTGKTLIMSSVMLYLYTKGYRNFVFFVDKDNIVQKTIENFTDNTSPKYSFSDSIVVDGKRILIRKVENFSDSDNGAINIKFITLAGLHSEVTFPKEEGLSMDDFKLNKTVFLSDEAHHVNASTKKKELNDEEKSWEYTVMKLLNSNQQNVLLEFTATLDEGHEKIVEKYSDKIIFKYDLKKYISERYSKDIFLYKTSEGIDDRILHALILSQYRRKLAGKYDKSFKPVVLIKSKTKKESENTETLFYKLLNNLKVDDLQRIERQAKSNENNNVAIKAFEFFHKEKVSFPELIKELQIEFSKERRIQMNDETQKVQQSKLLNSLEEETNKVRVIFQVKKLDEGWDVLNLFDIIRAYETRDTGTITTSEAQLVGRGARYFPFAVESSQEVDRRKYDEDINNELRVLEQLYYHCQNDHRYISEIKNALQKTGIELDNKRIIELKLKDSFKHSLFYAQALIYTNKQQKNDRKSITSLKDIDLDKLTYTDSLSFGTSGIEKVFTQGNLPVSQSSLKIKSEKILLKEIPVHITRTALDTLPFFSFSNLKTYLPNIKSRDEFITSNAYAGNIRIDIDGPEDRIETIKNDNPYLYSILVRKVFEDLKNKIIYNSFEYKGTDDFVPTELHKLIKDKLIQVEVNNESDKEAGKAMGGTETNIPLNLSNLDWYSHTENYGTSEEKYLIKAILGFIDSIKDKYNSIYLIRNERQIKIFDKKGRAIEPDFLLYTSQKKQKDISYYQLFIEPKGTHLLKEDAWKGDFLKGLNKKYKAQANLIETPEYYIFGLPLYNEQQTKREFETDLKEKLQIK